MKLNKKISTLFVLFFILLCLPISFASEDIILNENQTISTNMETIEPVQDALKYDEVYVDASCEIEGNGSADNPVQTISDGLNLVNDGGTIFLTGNFTELKNLNITLDGSPNNIQFIGIDAVIDGQNSNSFASVKSGTYTFNNISFVNNYKSGDEEQMGGALSNNEGTLTFINCLFENNGVYSINRANGGAIDNNGEMTIINCTFYNNNANISNSSGFRKNAADGGAISNLGKLYIYNSSFISNKALRNGGAIRTQDHAYALIENCNFTGNMAAYHESGGSFGGAIYSWDCALNVYHSLFENNRVYDISGYSAQGGAISSDRGSDKINILYCQFINNTADGVQLVHGQSIFFGSVDATVNYCTIDTSVYSASLSSDFNNNLWIVNDSNINSLIEMLPHSASVKNFANLEITCNSSQPELEKETVLSIDLYWNGTTNQNSIDLIPIKNIKLISSCGSLSNEKVDFNKGHFETTLLLNDTNNTVILANISNALVKLDFSKKINKNALTATGSEILKGEKAIISISSTKYMQGICLVDIDAYKFYIELENGKGILEIPNLDAGEYDVKIRYLGEDNEKTNATIIVKDITDYDTNATTKMDTAIQIKSAITLTAVDTNAKEKEGTITFKLSDINNNPVVNKSVQIALDGKIFTAMTDNLGMGQLEININRANTYTCAFSFSGDETYNASPLTITKLTVGKKKTTIKASAKTFKAKAKSKKISITLKTVKNQFDKKVYLYKGKKVTLKVNGKTYTAKTNAKGVAKFSIKLTKKGKYSAKIKFAGDKTYKASNKTIKITIK